MTWQSVVISGVQIAFALTLIPTLASRSARVPLATSVPAAMGLTMMAIALASLGLIGAAASTIVCAIAWALVAVYRNPFRVREVDS